jgi:hypothetical protein
MTMETFDTLQSLYEKNFAAGAILIHSRKYYLLNYHYLNHL